MGSGYFIAPLLFLVDTLVSLYTFAFMLRFVFQWVDADYYNPISQFLVRITHPPLRFMRRFVPAVGRVDTATLILIFGLQFLNLWLATALGSMSLSPAALAVAALAEVLELALNLFFFAILARALLSWVGPISRNPAASLLYSLTEPLLRASRRLIPPVGAVDLSPLLPLIGIQIAKMLLIPPLQQLVQILA